MKLYRKKHFFKFLLFSICILLFQSMTVNAYDPNEWKTTKGNGEGTIILDDNHDLNQKLYLYVLMENNLSYSDCKTYYEIFYLGKNKEEITKLNIEIYSINMEYVDTLNDCAIYRTKVDIEPGYYEFSNPGGSNGRYTTSLTNEYKSPYVGYGYYTKDDFYNGVSEITQIKENESFSVYGLYGSDEWRSQNDIIQSYADWAKGYDEIVKKIDDRVKDKTTTDNTDIFKDKTVEEYFGFGETVSQNEIETVDKNEEIKEEEPNLNIESSRTISVNEIVTINEEPKIEETKGFSMKGTIALIVLLLAAGICIYLKKRSS